MRVKPLKGLCGLGRLGLSTQLKQGVNETQDGWSALTDLMGAVFNFELSCCSISVSLRQENFRGRSTKFKVRSTKAKRQRPKTNGTINVDLGSREGYYFVSIAWVFPERLFLAVRTRPSRHQ